MRGERIDDLREQALAAAEGLSEGEHALVEVLREIEREKDRAASGYRAVVRSLAAAIEARDGYTGDHSDAVQRLSVAVALRLGLDRNEIDEIRTVALLHDVGKIGIPDHVLHNPDPLSREEWAVMRQHPVIGERILEPLPGLASVARCPAPPRPPPPSATSTSAGTAPATPTASPARRSRSRRASCSPATP